LINPKKSLGQNFIQDKNIIKKIISITKIHDQNIIEVGPGLGKLTEEIIHLKPKKLILIEKDFILYNLLKDKYKNNNITIINEDILNFNFDKLLKYKIISNLPYNISSKFILKVLKLNINIYEIVCMIQSELADKFDLSYGKMNKYKFICKYCSNYEIKFSVSPNVFYPKPKVNSKVVKFLINKQDINIEKMNYFMKYFFVNKRKKIKSNKNFINKIDKKYLNNRYEDLNYNNILEIYNGFKFSIS